VRALLYLTTEELLVKAGKVLQTPVSTTLFFIGLLAIFLLNIVGQPRVVVTDCRVVSTYE
jgi:hypothetical protein